jgi:hypothetical protein
MLEDGGWTRERVRAYVTEKKWKAKVIHEREVPAVRGREHAPSEDAGRQDGPADEVF